MILSRGLGVGMSFVRERVGRDGKIRYQALYEDLKGRRRSAGTFATEKQAAKAGQRAEAIQTVARVPERRVSRQTFKHYVKESWLPNHVVEATTRQNYTLQIDKRLIPEFGTMRMIDIMPLDVRQWITRMSDEGVKPPTIRYCMTILSAIFTTALNDQLIALHPCKGVKTPPVPKKPRTIITLEQFDTIYKKLPDARSRLLVEVGVGSGLRWGELTELRVRDIDPRTRDLTVSRAVVELLLPEFHPTGGRFLVKDYPKDREYRRFKLSHQIVAKLVAHIKAQALGRDDLLFSITRTNSRAPPCSKWCPTLTTLASPSRTRRAARIATARSRPGSRPRAPRPFEHRDDAEVPTQTLPEDDDTALDALSKIRNRSAGG